MVSLANMALKMGGFMIFGVAEYMWAFEQVFTGMLEFVGYELEVSAELFAAMRTLQVAFSDVVKPVLAIL